MAEHDLIVSDSCTCTSEELEKYNFLQDWIGHEFRNELEKHGFKGTFYPLWGKGLQAMCDAIQWFKDEGHNTESIAVLCAGNDIKFGEDHCRNSLSNIREHEVDIYNLIPDIEFEKRWVGKLWQLPNKEVHQKEINHETNESYHDQQEQKECPVCGGIEWSEIWGECVTCMKPKDIEHYKQ